MSILDELDFPLPPLGMVEQHRLALERIIEDPDQPRQTFDETALGELASSIGERGVLLPILVQPPDATGFYRIIDGARRYRASKLAGVKDIPVTMRLERSGYDQIIANIQRDDLRASEIAQWISERIVAGDRKSDIARTLGKSAAWVSIHSQYGEMPVELQAVANSSGMLTAVELYRAFKVEPERTLAFVASNLGLTRSEVNSFTKSLSSPPVAELNFDEAGDGDPAGRSNDTPLFSRQRPASSRFGDQTERRPPSPSPEPALVSPGGAAAGGIQVVRLAFVDRVSGRDGWLDLTAAGTGAGFLTARFEGDAVPVSVAIGGLEGLRLVSSEPS